MSLPGTAEVGRDGLSRICAQLATIHLRKARGSGNEYEELERLFREMTGGCQEPHGAAFFDNVLEPYTQVGPGFKGRGCVRVGALQAVRTEGEVEVRVGVGGGCSSRTHR